MLNLERRVGGGGTGLCDDCFSFELMIFASSFDQVGLSSTWN